MINNNDVQYQKGFQNGLRNKSISIAIKMVQMGYRWKKFVK